MPNLALLGWINLCRRPRPAKVEPGQSRACTLGSFFGQGDQLWVLPPLPMSWTTRKQLGGGHNSPRLGSLPLSLSTSAEGGGDRVTSTDHDSRATRVRVFLPWRGSSRGGGDLSLSRELARAGATRQRVGFIFMLFNFNLLSSSSQIPNIHTALNIRICYPSTTCVTPCISWQVCLPGKLAFPRKLSRDPNDLLAMKLPRGRRVFIFSSGFHLSPSQLARPPASLATLRQLHAVESSNVQISVALAHSELWAV